MTGRNKMKSTRNRSRLADQGTKEMLPVIFSLAWPTMLEQLMQTAVQYMDTGMVGVLGTSATAAVGATSTVNWLIGSTVSAISIGFLAYISQSIGAGKKEQAKKASGQAVLTVVIVGIFFTILTMGLSRKVPVWMQVDPSIQKLASSYFLEDKAFVKKFCFHSAAKSVHHGFVGGLLEHTLSVMKLCDFYTKSYPALNRDLLLTAALFHDIGKVQELSAFPENDYTDDGQLLGHIVIGTMMVADRIKEIPGFPAKTAAELKHCILAHHGELEYGSPKKPALLEALALNFADNTDAKMETMLEVLKSGGENPGWLGYNRFLETNVRKTTPTE